MNVETRIKMNYRLQYLKETVMARYIDEPTQKVIHQLIMNNNREIVQFIFGIQNNDSGSSLYYVNAGPKMNKPLGAGRG